MPETDPLWYKDAIIYQLHIKAYFDADNDGTGDFAGLIQKLDYISELGVTAIWVLPFYPSPLRDDGYDIAEYKAINQRYGRMQDFRRFLREAHRRDLKVITELVINHTSDQHPWFQRARHARAGSAWRNYYVWSDTDQKYLGTRIIFTDTETSNWAWDPVAQAYYWHRFFAHQPDLNFDNPRVFEAILQVMKFWLDLGVDGLRLDAIPYLCEREGTNNENLTETHDVLKKMRRWLDQSYSNRLLLGEANQWPEDVMAYFGDTEDPECHMAFHFPLMPRMYMALAQEDRHPVTDIMGQTPAIPEAAQWAIFLRNHDELTLEMVTDSERDYLWNFYASDPRMRVNIGIRRRLAPLVDNDRNKLQLLNSMLMSMPGTPIVYYGDEIGMGDNIFLGDRDSVRTPMQWTPDRNGGFSATDPARLYLPVIMDPVYGYQALNVESQRRNPSSYLNWMRRLIAVRKAQPAFGRGSLRFLYPGNRKVLAYLREYGEEIILCVANLSRTAQPAELDLAALQGRVPVELLGACPFPPIGELPYFLTLAPHGFYWFALTTETDAPGWHVEPALALPELSTLVLPEIWHSLRRGPPQELLETSIIPAYLQSRRWFAGREAGIESASLVLSQAVPGDDNGALMAIFEVTLGDGSSQQYFLPLDIQWEDGARDPRLFIASTLARVRSGSRPGFLLDALGDELATGRLLAGFDSLAQGSSCHYGAVRFSLTRALPDTVEISTARVTRSQEEQSNTSVRLGDRMIIKAYRRLQRGIHPELEIGHFLTEVAGYANAAPLLGSIEWVSADGPPTALAILQGFIDNQGDGWRISLDYLSRYLDDLHLLEEPAEARDHAGYLQLMATLGQRLAELHRAFAMPTEDPAFCAEEVSTQDYSQLLQQVRRYTDSARASLQTMARCTSEAVEARQLDQLLQRWPEIDGWVDTQLTQRPTALRTRCHGDLHLGQVLLAEQDFFIVDFEGEPMRSIAERRAKQIPLRDVAGLMRSIDYAAHAAVQTYRQKHAENPAADAAQICRNWCQLATTALLDSYRQHSQGCRSCPHKREQFDHLLALFMLEKACYEVVYEANHRPGWVDIPIAGLLDWLDHYSGADSHD